MIERSFSSTDQWALWVDIEGFSHFYKSGQKAKAKTLLGVLLEGLYIIGSEYETQRRGGLFVHQFGDGFVITDRGTRELENPLSLGIAILKLLLLCEGTGSVALSFGEPLADISPGYPRLVVGNAKGDIVPLGPGLMTFMSVMGECLVRAHELSSGIGKERSGPRFFVDAGFKDSISKLDSNFVWRKRTTTLGESERGYDRPHELFEVNWILSSPNRVEYYLNLVQDYEMQPTADDEARSEAYGNMFPPNPGWGGGEIFIRTHFPDFSPPDDPSMYKELLRTYLRKNSVSTKWKEGASQLIEWE